MGLMFFRVPVPSQGYHHFHYDILTQVVSQNKTNKQGEPQFEGDVMEVADGFSSDFGSIVLA